MKKRRTHGNFAVIIIVLILVLVFLYSGLQILESTVFMEGHRGETNAPSKTITRDGIEYFPRQDLTTLLVLGIDEYGPVHDSNSYNNSGAADMVALMVFDETNETCTVLCLNRDTMLEMPVLGLGGKQAGTIYAQLALAHTYGSGLEDSCENTRTAVSDFLYGINIDYYLSMNMDAISILNDAVGGVKVTVTEDFSEVDPSITMGEMVLHGEQAITFVRTRQGLGTQLNLSRMERHKEYMNGFMTALKASLDQSSGFVVEAYEDVADYVVTDCSVNTINSMVSRYVDYELVGIVSPEGENVKGKQYMEYYVDEEALDELILDLFYAEKE